MCRQYALVAPAKALWLAVDEGMAARVSTVKT
jgi:hypothetical protein